MLPGRRLESAVHSRKRKKRNAPSHSDQDCCRPRLRLAAIPSAFAFAEGTDFIKLEKPLPGGEGKLVKIWSYDCPFCFKYDAGVDPKMVPLMEKATGLKFDMFHLETKGKYGRAGSELFAYCLVKDKAAGITNLEDANSAFKKAKDAIYKAYHKKGERWAAGEDAFLKTGLDAAGISADEFAKNRKNADVQALADAWKPRTTPPRSRASRPTSSTASTSS